MLRFWITISRLIGFHTRLLHIWFRGTEVLCSL